MNQPLAADFIVIGAGILGLSVARSLKRKFPDQRILILEKEAQIGKHASGKNSGVLHSGIYYPPHSLKAKFCAGGARAMKEFCLEAKLPLNPIGKLILPTNDAEDALLPMLFERGQKNGAEVKILDEKEIQALEPSVRSFSGRALYSPQTSVIASVKVLEELARELSNKNVDIIYESRVVSVASSARQLKTDKADVFSYGVLVNCGGLQADLIAKCCKSATNFTMLPFKGIYYKLKKDAPLKLNHLIYPVPDMNVPFLGIHFTKSIDGEISIGPSALPSLGRENYHGLNGIDWAEIVSRVTQLTGQYVKNKNGFRRFAHIELQRMFRTPFISAARKLVPSMKPEFISDERKVGIRAQLFDKAKNELVMDFLVEKGENSVHILNAVSPGFTSAFSFSDHIVENFLL